MDSLGDILAGHSLEEPFESVAIKKYVLENFHIKPEVRVREREIIINVPSASLASTLRLQQKQLQTAAKTDKRLVFRIG